MSLLTPPMSSPASLKRSYADTGLDEHLRSQNAPISITTSEVPTSSQICSQSPSPANLPLLPANAVAFYASTATASDNSTAIVERSSKRTKLSYAEKEAEKEAKQIEKLFKEQQKAEEKVKKEEEKARKDEEKARKEEEKRIKDAEKEEEKAKKDEEKRIKDAEKEERKKVKEEQAKLKEAEKQRKLEDKNKKARSQSRLNAFFVQPSMPERTPGTSPARDTASPLSSRRSSIAEIQEMEAPGKRSRSVSVTPQKAPPPDYERQFPPFFLQSHTLLAPYSRFSRDGKGLEFAEKKIDESLNRGGGVTVPFNAHDLLHLSPDSSQRFPNVHRVKDIVADIHGSTQNPIDLTGSQFRRTIQRRTDLLKTVPMKYLKFFEDYRPPYIGTFTKVIDRRATSKLCKKPFSRELPNTNYDYDSEAEWEEPGEGEDLNSEGEEEIGEEEEENEMDGFLDDENDAVKKRPLLGDLEPTCSGICWEDLEKEDSKLANLDVLDLPHFKLDILMEHPKLPIDPYSTSYWSPITSAIPINTSSHGKGTLMEPPRIPLNPIDRQNTLLSPSKAAISMKANAPMKPSKGPKRLIPLELLEEFKKAVDGNELTKLGLLEVLKKQFPKQPKAALRDSLDTFAERVGAKEADKKWVLKAVAES